MKREGFVGLAGGGVGREERCENGPDAKVSLSTSRQGPETVHGSRQ